MEGTLTFLGTGTSMGVPTLGCACPVCTSTDPHDRRLRPSILLRWREPGNGQAAEERSVVIDTGPDFREQALRANWCRLTRCSTPTPTPTTFSDWTICAR